MLGGGGSGLLQGEADPGSNLARTEVAFNHADGTVGGQCQQFRIRLLLELQLMLVGGWLVLVVVVEGVVYLDRFA